MSEPGPESIPTSADPRSKRPLKRRAVGAASEQAAQINSLFKDPSKELKLPPASRTKTSSSLPAPPEIVANVQGSSAGAGSGEFHVYKASRRREYERVRLMEGEVAREKGDEEWVRQREEARRRDEERTERNRRKREKRRGNAKNKGKKDEKKDGDGMVLDKEGEGVGLGAGDAGGQMDQAAETPGVIIHDD